MHVQNNEKKFIFTNSSRALILFLLYTKREQHGSEINAQDMENDKEMDWSNDVQTKSQVIYSHSAISVSVIRMISIDLEERLHVGQNVKDKSLTKI